jgi:hypothetical protein
MSMDLGDEAEIPVKLGCPIMLLYFIVALFTKVTTNVCMGACTHTHTCAQMFLSWYAPRQTTAVSGKLVKSQKLHICQCIPTFYNSRVEKNRKVDSTCWHAHDSWSKHMCTS